MKHRILLLTSLLMVVVLFMACAPKSQATDVPDAGPTTSHGGPVEDYVSLVDALREAGAEVLPGETVEQAFFSVR
ncbi:MAG TPA: hypothetical protein VJ521_11895, partial [Acidobacteriota bacterium]|nr:hypothetical protein [Acidobacteriota bacterium]